MRKLRVSFRYNFVMVLLLAAIVADLVLGLDVVLNGISTIVVVILTVVILGLIGSGVVALCWIVSRDMIEVTRFERQNDKPWRWRLLGYAGMLGILADGSVGAWNAYNEHILLSAALERIPFAGVPLLLALASYPFKWIEQSFMRIRRCQGKSQVSHCRTQRIT